MNKFIFLILIFSLVNQSFVRGAQVWGLSQDDGRGKEIAEQASDFQNEIDSEEYQELDDSEEDKKILEDKCKSYFNILQERYPQECKAFLEVLQNGLKSYPAELAKLIIEYCESPNYEYDRSFMKKDCPSKLIQLRDGNLASYHTRGRIKIWNKNYDNNSWQLRQTLKTNARWFNSIVELNNGDLAICSSETTIKIWQKKSDTFFGNIKCLTGHRGSVNSLVELTNGQLASSSIDCTIKIWKQNKDQTWTCNETLNQPSWVRSIIQLPNGDLISGSCDGNIKIWHKNFFNKWVVEILRGHTNPIDSVIHLNNGSLASCSHDGIIKIWRQNCNKQFVCIQTLYACGKEINCLIQLQNGDLVSVCDDVISIWKQNSDDLFIRIQTIPCNYNASLTELYNGELLLTSNYYPVHVIRRPFANLLDPGFNKITNSEVITNEKINSISQLFKLIKDNSYKTSLAFIILAGIVQQIMYSSDQQES